MSGYFFARRPGNGIKEIHEPSFFVKKVFLKIPNLVSQKFKYSQVDREEKSRDIKDALHKLECARVVNRVVHSDANGIPLGAEMNDKFFKTIIIPLIGIR